MNITYLVGNGFDINLGIKSRYVDFYKAYVSIHSEDEPDVIKRFKDGINKYIKKESKKEDLQKIDWRDLEVALGQFTDQMDERGGEILYLDLIDKLKDYLVDEFQRFDADAYSIEEFCKHITNPVTEHFNRMTGNELRNLFTSYSNEENFNFINFNYTNTIEKLLRYKGGKLAIGASFIGRPAYVNNIYHVHQTLQDSEILIGVNDISQLNNKKYHENEFLRSLYVKQNTNNLLGSGVNQDCENLISNSDLFVIFGTTAGITDKRWWNLVCKRLINSSARLIYFVHNTEKKPHMRLYMEVMKNKVIREFLSRSGVDANVVFDKIIGKCYVSFSDKMFKLNENYNGRIKVEESFKLANIEVPTKVLKMKMKYIVVSVEAPNEESGIKTEALWLKEYFSNFNQISQELYIPKVEDLEIPFDIIKIRNKDCKKDIYFDISSFYGDEISRIKLKTVKAETKLEALKDAISKY